MPLVFGSECYQHANYAPNPINNSLKSSLKVKIFDHNSANHHQAAQNATNTKPNLSKIPAPLEKFQKLRNDDRR